MSGVDVVAVIGTLAFIVRADNGNLHPEINVLLAEAEQAAAVVFDALEALRACDAALMAFANQPLGAPPPWDHLSKALLSSQAALANVGAQP